MYQLLSFYSLKKLMLNNDLGKLIYYHHLVYYHKPYQYTILNQHHVCLLFLQNLTIATMHTTIRINPNIPQFIEIHTQAGVMLSQSALTMTTVAVINQITRSKTMSPKK